MFKICYDCKIEKKEENFPLRSDTGKRRNQCVDCRKISSKKWKKKNPEKAKENNSRWYKNNRKKDLASKKKWAEQNPEKIRDFHLKRTYGITNDTYESLLKKQNNLCAICLKPETAISEKNGKIRRLHVDHNHSTGDVRGLLCTRCNMALGYLKDDINVASSLLEYLKRF